ncbi:topoisomerase, putative, partial [Plasmodium ovale curtisi]
IEDFVLHTLSWLLCINVDIFKKNSDKKYSTSLFDKKLVKLCRKKENDLAVSPKMMNYKTVDKDTIFEEIEDFVLHTLSWLLCINVDIFKKNSDKKYSTSLFDKKLVKLCRKKENDLAVSPKMMNYKTVDKDTIFEEIEDFVLHTLSWLLCINVDIFKKNSDKKYSTSLFDKKLVKLCRSKQNAKCVISLILPS